MELVTPTPRIVCFGECMIELSRTALGGKSWALGHAGDCYNVAAYLARLGCNASFMSAIGTDMFSNEMYEAWVSEGVGTEFVLRHPERTPGLYAIRVDSSGERSFSYWRDQSAARAFFECYGANAALAAASTARVLYLSGITLSLYTEQERDRIRAVATAVRANGGDVVLDTNYRPRGWPARVTARRAIEALASSVTMALPTLEDDAALFGDRDARACADRWLQLGVNEVAVKLGPKGSLVATASGHQMVSTEPRQAVDTTGAGDSFNAAYLAARLAGHAPMAAARIGNRLAGIVVGNRGAIIPRVVMPMALIPAEPNSA